MSVLTLIPIEPKPNLLKTAKGIVYCIRNRINGLVYIGRTKHTFFKRYPSGKWWEHTTNTYLKDAAIEFGADNFEVFILDSGYSEDDLVIVEGMYIEKYNSLAPNGYNLTYDTDPLNLTGNGLLYMVYVKRREIRIFQKEPEDDFGDMYLNTRRVPCAESTKLKISAANKGKIRTIEQRNNIGDAIRGKKHTPEAIRTRSLALKGKHAKRVAQIDPKTKETLRVFDSISDATISIGLGSSSNLSSVCKGRQKTAGGYIFKYLP